MTHLDQLTTEQKRALLARALGGARRAPATFAQERLWFLDQLSPGEPTYNMPVALRLRGPVQASLLQRALDAMVARHAALRTTFLVADGAPAQHIAATMAVALTTIRVRDEHEAEQVAAREARVPFDLTQGPLVRARWIELADDDHLLLITLHHTVGDAASIAILLRELSDCYRAYAEGNAPELPDLPIQYADYARWQRHELPRAELERQLAYWKEHLAGAPPVLDLPSDFPRPPIQSTQGAWLRRDVDEDVTSRLRELCAKADVTVFMALLAAYKIVLARYAGIDDIVVGTPVSGRTLPETEPVIGLFVNTIALRTSLAGNPTFRQLLLRVRESTLDGLSHQELPFESLVESLAPERTLAHAPVCQVQMVFQAGSPTLPDFPGVQAKTVAVATGTAKVDLTLYAELRAHLVFVLEYRTDLFTPEWAGRFSDCLVSVLAAAVSDPDTRVADLPLLPAHRVSKVQATAPAVQTNVLRYLSGNTRLLDRAAHIGAVLRQAGVGPEVPVGLCLDRSESMLAGLLGIWFAGGQYVPLDPLFPPARLRMMAEDAGLRHMVTEAGRSGTAAEVAPQAQLIHLDALPSVPPLSEPVAVTGTGAAYTIFTSGSTGRPKGVTVPHQAVTNLIESFANILALDGDDCLVAVTTISFDIALPELLLPLRCGARLVIASADQAADPDALRELLIASGATVLQATPATWRMLCETGGIPPGVRRRLCGGEALPPDLAAMLCGPEVRLWNVYGPTETTVWSAAGVVTAEDDVHIGLPITATELYVLDSRLRPVPLGVTGELFIAGTGVARGYHANPGLTAARFLPDPFAPGRMYATGDLARRRAGGRLELLGRSDQQVKVRGFRVELGEIEAAMQSHPGIRQAAVTVVDGHLVGYAVPHPPDGLTGHLRDLLPEYMVPALFVGLPELTLTPNGKLDRARLPRPGSVRPPASVPPRTGLERHLAEIWHELLPPGVAIGVHDGFFALGGHSMAAVRLVARLRAEYGVSLAVREVFARQTIAELAAHLAAVEATPAPAVVSEPDDDPLDNLDDEQIEQLLRAALEQKRKRRPARYPAGFAQRQMWLVEQLAPDKALYHVAIALRLRGKVDADALARASNKLVARHEALRTAFEVEDGEPVQVVAPSATVDLHTADCRDDADEDRLRDELVGRPFALDQRPLLRLLLIRRGALEHRLVLVAHHAVLDQDSLTIVLRDLRELYRAEVTGDRPQLPQLRQSYGRYARWQRDPAHALEREEHLVHWIAMLRDAPEVIELPTDRPRPPVQTCPGASVRLKLPESTSEALDALCRREGVTAYQALLTGYATVLARYSQQHHVIVGSPISGRLHDDLTEVVGPFVNTVALRADLPGTATFSEVLAVMRERCLTALEHAEISFEELVARLRPQRSTSFSPVFQVMFVFNNPIGGEPESWAGVDVMVESPPLSVARYDLTLVMWQHNGQLQGQFDYNTDLFDAETIERLSDHFGQMLAAMAANPNQTIWGVPVGNAPEFESQDYSGEALVPALIEEQAARTPDAPAIIDGDRVISYGELLRQARAVAVWLRGQGAGPESRIGLCLPPGADCLIGLLGIMLAGGAYVPLDPSDPRTPALLADAGALLPLRSLEHAAGELTQVKLCETQAVYVIYTSGSTGTPKGVVVSHGSARNLACAFRDRHGFGLGDRILMIPPLTFDASVGDILPALICGAALVLHPEPAALTGPDLLAFCARHALTTVDAPSSLWQRWAEDLAHGPVTFPEGLIRMMVGGEAVPMARLRDWARASANRVTLYNHYGPTEATVCATTYSTVDGGELDGSELPIGVPLPNVRAYVLDRRGRPVPLGVAGELYLGGAGVARGYHGRPGPTAVAFLPDPFAVGFGERMYRTGDLAHWNRYGLLEFLGRADHQVKIRGRRIELGEIEATLAGHPGVRQVAVLAPQDAHGQQMLAAYVSGSGVDGPTLREHLRRRLPGYLVPSSYTVLDELPLTPHGKVDRAALPAPEAPQRPGLVEPRTDTERAIAQIWCEALAVEPVGVHDNFIDLGGQSLLAAKVLARVNQACGVTLPLVALLETATLAELALRIDGQSADATTVDLRAEAVLPEDLRIAAAGASRTPSCVLVTGATGFLGAYLLRELLQQTDMQLVCLVRAATPHDGLTRIEQNLRRYGLWQPFFAARIRPVLGDLAATRLGLAVADYAWLAEEVDTVYHNGGAVNFLYPYDRLRPANVDGTLEVLRLASAGPPAAVHYVSTLGIYLGGGYRNNTVTETVAPSNPDGLRSGYNQSKWVADALVRSARELGFTVTVHRPARITGDSQTGAGNPDDHWSAMLKAFVELGCVPDLAGRVDMAPVDYVAGAITRLSVSGLDGHYYNGQTIGYAEIADEIGVDLVPYRQWRERALKSGAVTAFAPYAAALPEEEAPLPQPVFDCSDTERAAAAAGLHCPAADRQLLRRYLDFLKESR